MSKNRQVIEGFLTYCLKTQKSQFLKKEILQFKELIDFGVLNEIEENNEVLELVEDSKDLQEIVLEIAIVKLKKELPTDIPEAYKFIIDFQDNLKEEYDCSKVLNSFNALISGLRIYVLQILHKREVNLILFLLGKNDKNREYHLHSFERDFFKFLPHSNYSSKEIFVLINELFLNERKKHNVITGLRELSVKNSKKGKQLLAYAYKNDMPLIFISNLLIGLYNGGEKSLLQKAIELKEKNEVIALGILGRLKYKNKEDVKTAYQQIGDLEFENKEIAVQQSYLIQNIIQSKKSTDATIKDAFKLYANFLRNGNDEIIEIVFQDVYFFDNNEAEKYNLLHLYLSRTKNFSVIDRFFNYFKDPVYIFDIMMRLFNTSPDYRFSMNSFENGIRHVWNKNQLETEKRILYLFEVNSQFGILGVKVILSAYSRMFSVDLLKLKHAQHQINAIDSICKNPHSFDKLLILLLPLRNSQHKDVIKHLQGKLARKVYSSYHETIFNQIQENISNSKKDKHFLKPIKKALDDYHKLKKLKESLNDLNPFENERDLMDLYYRLEHEAQAEMMNEVNAGKGTFMEMCKNTVIVRGNSWMFRDGEISALNKFESSMLIDGNSYLNPDLYEHNLNISE